MKRACGESQWPQALARLIWEPLALYEALARLAETGPPKAEEVKLRFLAGLTVEQTAERVGLHQDKPVVLEIKAGQMYREGHTFYLSANGF